MRKDVVHKTILRNMRRFYLRKFNAMCNYSCVKKNRKFDFYRNSIQSFALELFGPREEGSSEEEAFALHSALGAIIYPKDMAKHGANSQERTLMELFHQCLYRYSHSKLEQLFENRTLAMLFQHFASAAVEEWFECDGPFLKNREIYVAAVREISATVANSGAKYAD